MKKALTAILVLTLALSCVLVGCGGKQDLSASKYLGVWKVDSTQFKDQVDKADDVFGGDFIIEFKADGTAVSTYTDNETGETEVSNCTWKETGSGVKLSGDMKLKLEDVNGNLDGSIFGFHMIFVKQAEPTT